MAAEVVHSRRALAVQIREDVARRSSIIAESVRSTVGGCDEIDVIARLFLRWMKEESIVRVLGKGRARLAAAVPANRLAHGGARVYVQDGFVPMPSTNKGGGVIAASASGKTRSLLRCLEAIREEAPKLVVVGIASADAGEFQSYCHHFIGIRERPGEKPLTALADLGEYVLSEVLDALVVAAGRLGGFDERTWRLGHENIGETGPYALEKS